MIFKIVSIVLFSLPQEFPEFTRVLKNPLEGRKIFVEKGCITCHSLKGTGGKLGPDLGSLTKRLTFLRFAGLLFSHSPRMLKVAEEMGISWSLVTPGEIASLFGYLYYLNYFEEPGDYSEGKRVFSEKRCVLCHTVGKGKFDLKKYADKRSPIFLFVGMWNSAEIMTGKMKKRGIEIPFLSGRDFINILAYIRGESREKENVFYLKPGNPLNGEKLFQKKKCSSCHSIHGKGKKIGPDLGDLENVRGLSDILSNLWNHATQMISMMKNVGIKKPSFTYEEMNDLLSYLYSVQYYDERGDVKNGERVYREKMCSYCHETGKAEKLTQMKVLSSPFVFAAAAWNHIPIMFESYEKEKILWPRFENDEMRDLVEYLIFKSKTLKEEKGGKK
jgi:cytochrome c2